MLMNNAYNNMQNAPVPLFCLWIWCEYDFYTHEVHSFFITTKKKQFLHLRFSTFVGETHVQHYSPT